MSASEISAMPRTTPFFAAFLVDFVDFVIEVIEVIAARGMKVSPVKDLPDSSAAMSQGLGR